jgi:hypothetical protein
MHGAVITRARPLAALRAGLIAVAAALCLLAQPAPAADPPAPGGGEATIKITPFPPSVSVDARASDDADAASAEGKRSKRTHKIFRIDSDRDFESFKDAMHTAPWIVGLVFLVVGSIFLTPVVLLVGIVWYKLRKTRLQNEALLKLAESGVMPSAQAVDAVTSGIMPASVAGSGDAASAANVYQQAVATRRRAVWSDLRKGVLLGAIGLSIVVYSTTESGSPNWLGLALLFVGIGYLALWWLEDRQLAQRAANDAANRPG